MSEATEPEWDGESPYAAHVDAVKAEFHALWFKLGPFGRQDVHLHPRFDRQSPSDVLVGFGQTCDPKRLHVQMKLHVGSSWSKRGQEGQPLVGAVGKEPKPRAVVVPIAPSSSPSGGREEA